MLLLVILENFKKYIHYFIFRKIGRKILSLLLIGVQ